MNPDEQHAKDWEHVKQYNEEMYEATNEKKHLVRIQSCERLLATIK